VIADIAVIGKANLAADEHSAASPNQKEDLYGAQPPSAAVKNLSWVEKNLITSSTDDADYKTVKSHGRSDRRPRQPTRPPEVNLRTMLIGRVDKASGVLVFMSGDQAKQIAVGFSLQRFSASVEFAQRGSSKNAQCIFCPRTGFGPAAIFDFQFIERSQGNAVAAVEVAEDFKDLGFELMIGLKLRGGMGVCSFMNSHGLPASIAGQLRLGRVRC